MIPTRVTIACAVAAVLALAAGLAAGTEPGTAAEPGAAWLAHLRSCLDGVHSLSARFTHDLSHPLGVRGAPETGRLELRRGGRLRLDYDNPPGRVVAADGRSVRSYDPRTRLFVEQPARDSLLPRAFAFLLDPGAAPGLTVGFLGGATAPVPGGGRAVIALVPAAERSVIERVALVLEPLCPGVRRVVVVERGGTASRFTFEEITINPGIGHKRFVLTPPAGVAVVHP
ncbi:MAG TPA: outer membrane lipoprotein carrier protein LolA [Phycisphaerae bacterium]|nr:outer membrane lipoprotein carrier protein LolA [Phycisphaerae bacterium]